jgi:DnaK suppressor protein
MNTKTLSTFRSALESELSRVHALNERQRADLIEMKELQPSVLRDFHDHARDERDLNAQLEVRKQRLAQRQQLQRALVRLDDGTFGICDRCGDEIAERRLLAEPRASYCISCQRIHEKRSAAKQVPEPVTWISRADLFAGQLVAA